MPLSISHKRRGDIIQQDMVDNMEQSNVCQDQVNDIGQSCIQQGDSACQDNVSDAGQSGTQERDGSACQDSVSNMGQSSIHEDSNQGRKQVKGQGKTRSRGRAERKILFKIEDK